MHGCFQEGIIGRPCKPPPGHRSIDYDFQHLDVGIPVVNRDPSICEGHVRPRDERASAGRLLAETNQPGKQPRVDQTRTTAREGSEDGSSAGALTRTSIGKSWDLATCGCIIFGAPLSCMPTNKEEEGKEERERDEASSSFPLGRNCFEGREGVREEIATFFPLLSSSWIVLNEPSLSSFLRGRQNQSRALEARERVGRHCRHRREHKNLWLASFIYQVAEKSSIFDV